MICVEVGHVYVGDPPASLMPAILAYESAFFGARTLIMIDDISWCCEGVPEYVAAVRDVFAGRRLHPRIVLESDLVPAAEILAQRLGARISTERFPGKCVGFFKDAGDRVKVWEDADEGPRRFSCPALVAALTLTRAEAWGATRLVSILPGMYGATEAAADRLSGALGVTRETVWV